MPEPEPSDQVAPPARWAEEVVQSLRLARTISRVLLVLGLLALVLGVVAAATAVWQFGVQNGFEAVRVGNTWDLSIEQASLHLLSSLLPAGVLLAASAFLRMYAIRFEIELLEDDEREG